MNENRLYYYQLKNGEIRYSEKMPKGRMYIADIYARIDNNETRHRFEGFNNNGEIIYLGNVFSCFCGYDRQVMFYNKMRKAFEQMNKT